GTSSYLIFTKYNNYAGFDGGDGVNRIAILDPNATMVDPHPSSDGLAVMNVVMSAVWPTPDFDNRFFFPNPVKEWCINTAAVDPFTKSVLVNSEDGKLYRWDLTTNTLSESITLTPGLGEAYTPTAIGPDGTVYAINNATLFAVGRFLADVSASAKPATSIFGHPVKLTATFSGSGPQQPMGTVTFFDGTTALGTAKINGNGTASLVISTIGAGTHSLVAAYNGDANYVPSTTNFPLTIAQDGSNVGLKSSRPSAAVAASVTFTASVTAATTDLPVTSGTVTFFDGTTAIGSAA